MIGSNVAAALIARKRLGGVAPPTVRVFGMARFRSDMEMLQALIPNVTALTLLRGDLDDPMSVAAAVRTACPAIVFHFGAQAYNGVSWGAPSLTMHTNVIGTLNLLEALRAQNLTRTRVLMAASSAQYGSGIAHSADPVGEQTVQLPLSPYGVSKAAMELLGRQFGANFGMPIMYARLFPQIGLGQSSELAIQNFCRQVALVEAGLQEPRVLVGNLSTQRDYSDVQETAVALVHLGFRGVPGEAYNMASGKAHRMSDLLNMIIEMAHVPIAVVIDKERLRPADEALLLGDNRKVRNQLDWQPRMDLRRAIGKILRYWRTRAAMLRNADQPPPLDDDQADQHQKSDSVEDEEQGKEEGVTSERTKRGRVPIFSDKSGQVPPAKTLSIAITSRNDEYARGQARRTALCLDAMLRVADEVVLLDFNSLKPPVVSTLPQEVREHPRLKSVVITPADCRRIKGIDCGDRYFQTLARNLAVDAATSDVIVSSNIDIIPPIRPLLDLLLKAITDWRITFTISRKKFYNTGQSAAHLPLLGEGTSVPPYGDWVFARKVSLNSIVKTLPKMRKVEAFKKVSLIANCGDFQMAHRELWRRAKFAEAMEGRQYDDTMLQASWLNNGAIVYEPMANTIQVGHMTHERPFGGIKKLWNNRTVYWNHMPTFAIKRVRRKPQLVNLIEPPIPWLPNGTERWVKHTL